VQQGKWRAGAGAGTGKARDGVVGADGVRDASREPERPKVEAVKLVKARDGEVARPQESTGRKGGVRTWMRRMGSSSGGGGGGGGA